jgi:hypothetical protein
MIIYIPTKCDSNEIKSFVVIFVPRQPTLSHVVERRRDHVLLLYDLPNGTTLAQKIVASLIFPITEILTFEDYKSYITFLYVAFESQSQLKPTSDQISSENWRRQSKGVE